MDQNISEIVEGIEQSIHRSQWLTPSNLSEEREKFLLDFAYDPQLTYPDFDKETLQDNLALLDSLNFSESNSLEDWVVRRKIEYLKLEIELFLALNTDKFTAIACTLFQCTFNPSFLENARKDATSPLPFVTTENKTSAQIIEGIEAYLAGYHIFDWKISLSEATDFYFRVQANKKQILIGKRFNWDFCDFDNMLAHEIDGHVIRAVNASKQKHPLLQKPFPFYIKTEEGLASFLGDYCSTTAEISRKHHALKYLAGDLARKGSFKEVFEFLVESGFTPDLAFQRTFRLKRGISDTSRPGCFAREAMYYEGMLEVKTYLDQGNNVERLYAGKIGLEDLDFIEITSNIIVPERLKRFYKERWTRVVK